MANGRRCVGVIQRNLRRARKLVDNVRALALADAGAAGPARLRPIGVVLGEVLAEVGEVARQAGVELEVNEPIPDLLVDASLLEIILLNLIENAAKYFDPAQPRSRVRIGFERDRRSGDGWWGYVSDNGLGIPAEHQPRVFERFFRGHPERADGSGLGLAIVREAIRQLGAEIHFESGPGKGSTFRFRLPAPDGSSGPQGD